MKRSLSYVANSRLVAEPWAAVTRGAHGILPHFLRVFPGSSDRTPGIRLFHTQNHPLRSFALNCGAPVDNLSSASAATSGTVAAQDHFTYWDISSVTLRKGHEVYSKGMGMQTFIVVAVVASMTGSAFAQTQPTRQSAYATVPTIPSAFATAPINPCYSGPSQERYFAPFHDHAWTNRYNGPRHRWSSFNPTSPCYTGTKYPSYSAIEQFEFPNRTDGQTLRGANSFNEDQAKLRIEGKGYLNVSGLQKDNHGIWRGKATMKNGRSVAVILDLDGNIYSEWYPFISIRPLNSPKQ
jgi:hypothetical protein